MKKCKKVVSLFIALTMMFSMAVFNVKAETTGADFIFDADNFEVGDRITLPDWLEEKTTATVQADENGEKYITNLQLYSAEAPSTEFVVEATPISTNEYSFIYVDGWYDGVEKRVWQEWYSEGNADNTVESYTDVIKIDNDEIKLTEAFTCSSVTSGESPAFNTSTAVQLTISDGCKINELKIWYNQKDDADAFTSQPQENETTETPETTEDTWEYVDGWGYTEDFEDMYVGANAKSEYVEFAAKHTVKASVTGDSLGIPTKVSGGLEMYINVVPEKEWKLEFDMNAGSETSYTWLKLGYVDAEGNIHNGELNGQTFMQGSGTITLQGTVTDELKAALEGAQKLYVTAGGGTDDIIDAIRINIDNKKLQRDPYYVLNMDDYTNEETMISTSVVKPQNIKAVKTDESSYMSSANGYIDIDMCSKRIVVEADTTAGELYGRPYNAAGVSVSNKTSGWYLYQGTVDGKARIILDAETIKADAANSSADDKTPAYFRLHFGTSNITGLKIWYDDEENILTSWSYEEDFEGHAVGIAPSTTYVTYSSGAVAEDATSGSKILSGGNRIVLPAPEKYWQIELKISADLYWGSIGSTPTHSAQKEGAFWDNMYGYVSGGFFRMGGTAVEGAESFTIYTHANIESIKVNIDGKNMTELLSYEMNLTKYDNGESLELPSWITSTGKVVENETEKYLDGVYAQIWIEAPETGMTIEADIEPSAEGETAAIHVQRGDADKKWIDNIKTYDHSTTAVTKRYVIKSSDINGASYIGLNLNKLKLNGLRIYTRNIAPEPAEAWTATPYTFMSDFEVYEVDTCPDLDGMIKLTQSTVKADENGNKFMQYNSNTVAVEIDTFPEENVIISFDGRFRANGDTKEQLQLQAYNASNGQTTLRQDYDSYVEDTDTAWHTYTYNIDMVNKKITLFIDGVAKYTNQAWKSVDEDVLAASTKLICKFIQLDVDNLNVAVDTEKVYAGSCLSDANGKLTTVTSNADVYGNVYGASFLRNENNAEMIIALYEQTDNVPKLVKCQSYDINANRAGKYITSEAFNVGELEAGKTYMIKQFVWDSMDGMTPLTINSSVVQAQ